MRNEGLGSWPARRARKTPHRTAVLHRERTVTYAELDDRTTRLAHVLRAHGVRRGDRVAFLGPNHPAYLETFFATGALGAVFLPLNTRLSAPEIDYQIADSGARIVVHTTGHAALVGELASTPGRELTALPVGTRYERLIAEAPAKTVDESVTLDDVCVIMYTSGTTGRPKGAMLTHGNLTWNAVNVLIDHDLITEDVALVSAPLFHTAALNMLALPVLLKGGSCLLTESFDAGATFELVEHHRVSFMFGVPAMYRQMALHPHWNTADLSSLRLLTCGGSPVPRPLIEAYQDRGLTFMQGYGMTEASPGTLFLDAEHSVSKAGTAGVPHFFSDVRVVGPGAAPVEPGVSGEVVVRGPHVMAGYWGLPDATEAAFSDGWFHSGDAARTDDDGYVTILGRYKDMIISGGENIYPAEVEEALLSHPGIAECAVIGVPDERWGEVGRAVVVALEGVALDAEEVRASLSGRLAKYKIPKTVVITERLPRNAAGKLLKARLREQHTPS